jgi:hypothetical protein
MDVLAALFLAAIFLTAVALAVWFLSRSRNATRPQKAARQPTNGRLRWWAWLLLGVFFLAWSSATLYLDGVLVWAAVKQYRAQWYHTTEGKVTKCSMTEGADSSYDVDLEYTFQVADHRYRGTRVRYYKLWHRTWVAEFVAKHPSETPVTVYFDPVNPVDAVLVTEMDGGLPWMAMFLVPFNIVMVGFITVGIHIYRDERSERRSFEAREHDGILHVNLGPIRPFGVAVAAFLVTSLVAAVFMGLCCGMPPSVTNAVIAWGFVLCASGLAYFRVSRLMASGYYDLRLNRVQKTLTVPGYSHDGNPVAIAFRDILSIEVVDLPGSEDQVTYQVIAREKMRETKLAEWNDKDRANEMAAFLRRHLSESGALP